MQPRIMITHGGTHPARKWAEVTAWKIVDLVRIPDSDPDSSLPETDRDAILQSRAAFRQAKEDVEPKVAAVLLAHHEAVQSGERRALVAKGADLARGHDRDVDAIIGEVVAAFAGTVLAAHFAKQETQDGVRKIVEDDFGHHIDVERSWHRDDPNAPHLKAVKAN